MTDSWRHLFLSYLADIVFVMMMTSFLRGRGVRQKMIVDDKGGGLSKISMTSFVNTLQKILFQFL